MIDWTVKLFERIILNRMEKVCREEDNEGIFAAQFSFHKGLSTDHVLKKVEERGSSRTTGPRRIVRHNSARRQECV